MLFSIDLHFLRPIISHVQHSRKSKNFIIYCELNISKIPTPQKTPLVILLTNQILVRHDHKRCICINAKHVFVSDTTKTSDFTYHF